VTLVKTCRACRETKPLTEFTDRPKSRNGKRAMCKRCMGKRQSTWAKANRGKRAASEAKWRLANPGADLSGARARRKQNPEKYRSAERRRYIRNADKKAAAAQAYRDRDREAYNARVRARRKARPEIVSSLHSNRKSRESGLKITPKQIKAQLDSQNGSCYYCRMDLQGTYDVDHFEALASGGLNVPENIVIACKRCNRRKNRFSAFALFEKLGIKVEPLRRIA
jgi:5-methylcytosine-specific restriction endonuclease McrA